jgi:hypothetical protein
MASFLGSSPLSRGIERQARVQDWERRLLQRDIIYVRSQKGRAVPIQVTSDVLPVSFLRR